ncbi:hypothetical protein B0H13DRAFT_2317831 [Mycena leptocephala]|nr:hypothetical protein B0H13DRAFT_2317831 [Mycena leptocephala]
MATTCPEEHYASSLITGKEKLCLEEDCELVGALENIYSSIIKDRKSNASVLTWEESFRFRRSMYRVMLYCELFGGSHYHLNEIDNLDEGTIKKVWRQRTAVLNAYPLDQILEIYSPVGFLRSLLEKLMEDELMRTEDEDLYWLEILLSACPASVRQAWEERDCNVLAQDLGFGDDMFDDNNKLFSGYFLRAFHGVWASRKLPTTITPKNNEHPSRWILVP